MLNIIKKRNNSLNHRCLPEFINHSQEKLHRKPLLCKYTLINPENWFMKVFWILSSYSIRQRLPISSCLPFSFRCFGTFFYAKWTWMFHLPRSKSESKIIALVKSIVIFLVILVFRRRRVKDHISLAFYICIDTLRIYWRIWNFPKSLSYFWRFKILNGSFNLLRWCCNRVWFLWVFSYQISEFVFVKFSFYC